MDHALKVWLKATVEVGGSFSSNSTTVDWRWWINNNNNLASVRSPIRSAGLGYLPLADISPFALWGALANAAPALTRVSRNYCQPVLERATHTALTAVLNQLDTDPADKVLPPTRITDIRECLVHYCHPRNRHLGEHLQRNLQGALASHPPQTPFSPSPSRRCHHMLQIPRQKPDSDFPSSWRRNGSTMECQRAANHIWARSRLPVRGYNQQTKFIRYRHRGAIHRCWYARGV